MKFSFEIFDILSPEITLFYKGKVHHSSIYSAILSLISIIIIITFSIIFLQDLKRKNPSAFFYNRFLEEIKPIPYNSTGLFHLLNLTDEKFPYEPNKIFTIVGIDNYMYHFDFNNIESFDHYLYIKLMNIKEKKNKILTFENKIIPYYYGKSDILNNKNELIKKSKQRNLEIINLSPSPHTLNIIYFFIIFLLIFNFLNYFYNFYF